MNINELLKSNYEFFEIEFEMHSYVFRGLTIKESKFFNSLLKSKSIHPYYLYEQIFELVYVGNLYYLNEKTPIGHMITIGNLAYWLSLDHNQIDILFEIAKVRKVNPVDTIYEHMRSVIFTAFKSYKFEEIESLTKNKFIELFVVAENILTKNTPNFVRLDVKKIYDDIYGIKEPEKKEEVKQESSIDKESMRQQVKELNSAAGYWEKEEAEEKNRKLMEEELKLKILRELDKQRR